MALRNLESEVESASYSTGGLKTSGKSANGETLASRKRLEMERETSVQMKEDRADSCGPANKECPDFKFGSGRIHLVSMVVAKIDQTQNEQLEGKVRASLESQSQTTSNRKTHFHYSTKIKRQLENLYIPIDSCSLSENCVRSHLPE